MVLAALCSMVAGGIALGGGRYAQEVSEREAREALIAEEREQLHRDPEEEFRELVEIYRAKGLSLELAQEVAAELTAVDALAAHVDAKHQLPLRDVPQAPLIIGGAAGLAYALGALVPLMAVFLMPDPSGPRRRRSQPSPASWRPRRSCLRWGSNECPGPCAGPCSPRWRPPG